MIAKKQPKKRSQRDADATRAAILAAALDEFAVEGAAGARTDQIARAARVNKAMLYYYFKDKDALHKAALDHIFTGLRARIMAAIHQNLSSRERLLAYVRAHFDYIAESPNYPRLVQWEMMRAGRSGGDHLGDIVNRYLRPIFGELVKLLEEGKRAGEFRQVNSLQFIPTMISVIVSYFIMRPTLQLVMHQDPMLPTLVAERRVAVADFISTALFTESRSMKQDARRRGRKK